MLILQQGYIDGFSLPEPEQPCNGEAGALEKPDFLCEILFPW